MTPPRPASPENLVALRRSVADGTLELLYQPEVELDSGALVAMEGVPLAARRPRRARAAVGPRAG